jgi:hypothetical protein
VRITWSAGLQLYPHRLFAHLVIAREKDLPYHHPLINSSPEYNLTEEASDLQPGSFIILEEILDGFCGKLPIEAMWPFTPGCTSLPMNPEARTLMGSSSSLATAAPSVVIPVGTLGRASGSALRSESRWEVRAVFRRSFYCRSERGALVCVGPTSLDDGPLNVRCRMPEPIDWEASGLTPHSVAACDGVLFRVAERFVFSLADAAVWRPPPPSASWSPAKVRQGLAALVCETRAWSGRGGLQPLVPILAGNPGAFPRDVRGTEPLLRLARAGIEPLIDWLEASLAGPTKPLGVPGPAIDRLIGLGPGLTPSGDDFLGGVLLGLRHLGASHQAGRLARAVLSRAEQGTNEISRAHLRAAADGEGLATLHAILQCLCAPDASDMEGWLSAVDAIGHTSGWDALAGIVLAAAALARARSAMPGMAASADGSGFESRGR